MAQLVERGTQLPSNTLTWFESQVRQWIPPPSPSPTPPPSQSTVTTDFYCVRTAPVGKSMDQHLYARS